MVAAAVGVGTAVAGVGSSIIAGNKAAKASSKAAQLSADNERYFYDTSRADNAPAREVGQGALYKLASMYGVGGGPGGGSVDWNAYTQNNPDVLADYQKNYANKPGSPYATPGDYGKYHYNTFGKAEGRDISGITSGGQQGNDGGFQASPGYQFRLNEGVKAAEHSAAARGLLGSGATMKGIQRYGEGLASSEYENYGNRLASLAGIGQNATNATTSAGQTAANGISNAFTNAGNARASSYATTGAAINNGLSNSLSSYLRYGQGGGMGASNNAYGIAGSDGIY